jgi:hypothetical protein
MAKEEAFLSATARGLNHKTMRDRECINRFLAFGELGLTPYTGNMDNYLRDVLKQLKDADQGRVAKLTDRFLASMRLNEAIFGEHAFRKVKAGVKPRRSVINVALFDVFSVLLARPEADRLTGKPDAVRAGLNTLLEQPDFVDAITLSTNSVRKVNLRFERVENMLAEVWDATTSSGPSGIRNSSCPWCMSGRSSRNGEKE